jgi:hypothetical protein
VAVLDADLPGESGWLTCAKLVHENPLVKVVLVDPNPDARQEDRADFVGASALVDRADGLPALLEVVEGATLPAAG